jgi:ferredoxin
MIQIVVAKDDDMVDAGQTVLAFDVDEGVDLEGAVCDACEEYVRTSGGLDTLKNNDGYFNWLDFDKCVPNEICEKYGFRKMDDVIVNEHDCDEQLVDEDLEELMEELGLNEREEDIGD